ncbi:MAG: peptidylprolyl isomerase [bacterium]
MRNPFCMIILCAFFAVACSKTEQRGKLEEGSPAYQLAKELSSKLPLLNPDENRVLITTTSFKITTGDVIESLQENYGKSNSRLKIMDASRLKAFIEKSARDLAEKNLLLQAAKGAHFAVDEAMVDSLLSLQYARFGSEEKFAQMLQSNGVNIENLKKQLREGLTIQGFIDEFVIGKVEVSEEEIEKAYQEDKTVSVRHILLTTQGKSDSAKKAIYHKMEEILTRAQGGEDFAELAKKYTEDPGSKKNGGLYENFGRGKMVKPFEDAAFSVPVGEISDIVETKYGYHILKVIDRKKETRPLDEVRPELEALIKKRKQAEAYKSYVEKLKEEAAFKVMES